MTRKYIIVLTFFLCSVSLTAQITARQWNAEVTAGWNLGNQFECSPQGVNGESVQICNPEGALNAETAWGNPVVTKRVIKAVKDAGFNAVRIPVRWQFHITNPSAMSIDKEWIARIREVVDWCLEYDMKVIINAHHEKWLESRPTYKYQEINCQKLALLWLNIASAFGDYDYRVAFAGTNEVHMRDDWGKPSEENLAVQNSYNQTFIDIVRATGGNNEKRHLIVQTYVCNPDFGLYNGDFIIPEDVDGNGLDYMSVEFHYYNPWDYAGECTYYFWGQEYKEHGEISPSDEKTLTDSFDRIAAEWGSKGLGVVIGEWGVTDHYKTDQADIMHENMTYYCRMFVQEARKRGFATFIWDNSSFGNGPEKFGIFDRHRNMRIRSQWILDGIIQ